MSGYAGGMFAAFAWCIAFPLALAAEALTVIAALEWFADEQPRPDLVWAAAFVMVFAVGAFVVGYTFRKTAV